MTLKKVKIIEPVGNTVRLPMAWILYRLKKYSKTDLMKHQL